MRTKAFGSPWQKTDRNALPNFKVFYSGQTASFATLVSLISLARLLVNRSHLRLCASNAT